MALKVVLHQFVGFASLCYSIMQCANNPSGDSVGGVKEIWHDEQQRNVVGGPGCQLTKSSSQNSADTSVLLLGANLVFSSCHSQIPINQVMEE